ncbi:MAG: sigma 54-interacting transcriptional regulator [Candidatus Binatia bacterium]
MQRLLFAWCSLAQAWVGSSHTIKVDVRVIAATNRNLQEVVRSGTFRADLFLSSERVPPRSAAAARASRGYPAIG